MARLAAVLDANVLYPARLRDLFLRLAIAGHYQADTRGVYVPMTRGRLANEAFVVVEGEQTALDVMAQALARDWIDEPAVARRAELQRSTPRSRSRGHGRPLEPAELRSLLERRHATSEALSAAESRVSRYDGQIARATKRHAELVNRLVAATALRDEALQVVDDHDHPLRRRLHRSEPGQAHANLWQAGLDIDRLSKELAEIDRRLPDQRSSARQADQTLRDQPALDREGDAISHALQCDLAARKAAIAADPPERFADWLGPRSNRGSADLWDDAAAHIDQHRSAFGSRTSDTRSARRFALGSGAPSPTASVAQQMRATASIAVSAEAPCSSADSSSGSGSTFRSLGVPGSRNDMRRNRRRLVPSRVSDIYTLRRGRSLDWPERYGRVQSERPFEDRTASRIRPTPGTALRG